MGTEKQRPDVQMTYLFSDFIEKYIDSNKINSNTLKTYKSFLKKVTAFNTCFYPLDVVNLNNQNVKDFFDFLSLRFNYTTNTFDKNIGIFSTFISKCRESKIPTISDLTILNSIKKPRYTPDDIYLNFEEINLIRKYESPDIYKNRVRDIFIILCLTGQRVDEYKFIESAEVIEDEFRGQVFKYINIVPKITNNKKKIVCVPILKPVDEIRNRWNGFPEKVPDQKINEIIKEICEDVGIDSTVYIREQRIHGNQLLKKKRFEIVTTHTGRRSFITNFLALGVQDAIISRITGHVGRHNASKAFAKYIKLEGAQNVALFFQEIDTNIELGKIDLPFDLTYKP
jgi:integrase